MGAKVYKNLQKEKKNNSFRVKLYFFVHFYLKKQRTTEAWIIQIHASLLKDLA